MMDDIGTQMKEELRRQAEVLQTAAQAEENFYEEIERRASEMPDFAKKDAVSEWNPQEVAFWLDSMELGQYGRTFHGEGIDGSMILNDIDTRMLLELGVKQIHVRKILREIDILRQV